MTDEREFAINKSSYDWCVRTFQFVEKRLGLNIEVHNPENQFEKGHIFLFNHFARFETIIPPYIIYRATGSYCRSVADHALFEISEGFGNFLRGVGAVPNNLPGLLPFLAAEILRGRKVVMFPEGGMVKDRSVIDGEGDFSVFSRSAEARRKHHRGAAVLALTLDILKHRILDLQVKGDHPRLMRWVVALGLDSLEQLLARAIEPTLIVPANITFYPIRVRENVLSRGAEMFSKNLPQQLSEELLIEGNLLFRETDMDIRLSEPIETVKIWRWWEQVLLRRYFKKVRSLDDLFGLKDQAETWTERMLARCLCDETLQIRDQYMRAMYTSITVNLSHLTSHIIIRLIGQGRMSISLGEFHRILYMSLKNLQATVGMHLHRSLLCPDSYRGVIDGDSPDLDRFLEMAKNAGLVGRTPSSYRFLDKLCEDFAFDEIRLENPIVVYDNEVAPIPQVLETVEAAMARGQTVSEEELASFLFDDELRAYAWNREHFSTDAYREINDQETATESGAPYLLLPGGQVKTGVLLVHGFLASPAELQGLAGELLAQGYAVLGVRLSGHGTSPWDLKTRTWKDWLKSVRRAYRILSAFSEHVVMVGFSAGGTLALMYASEHPAGLAGVSAVCTPLSFRDHKMALVPMVNSLNKLTSWIPSVNGVKPFHKNDSEHPETNYHHMPVDALAQLSDMTSELQRRLVDVTAPTQVLQADADPVITPDSAERIHDLLGSEVKYVHLVPSKVHGILRDDISGARRLVSEFITEAESMAEEHGGGLEGQRHG